MVFINHFKSLKSHNHLQTPVLLADVCVCVCVCVHACACVCMYMVCSRCDPKVLRQVVLKEYCALHLAADTETT